MDVKNVAKRLSQAQAAQKSVTQPNATNIAIAVVSLIGFVPVLAMALLLLVVIIVLTGTAASAPDPTASGSIDALSASTGDGKGALAEDRIPNQALVKPLEKAATECDLLGPAILAAQIQVESGFDAKKVGPDGKVGISQLPPDVFKQFGKDDDHNGKVSALDPTDSIFAQARYLCSLADQVQQLLDTQTIVGDKLTLTLLAYHEGIDAVKQAGGTPVVNPDSYPFQVRNLFSMYLSDGPQPNPSSSPSPSSTAPGHEQHGSFVVTEAQFDQMFPDRNPFYTYAGLVDAMGKFPAFADTGDDSVRRQEAAAFLANVSHESGGLVYVEEINKSAWGDYCDAAQPYGCPAGQTAYHGRGPIELSWNTNYKAAGDALGVDLLHDPDKVKTDPAVSWGTALWFWMTQSGAGSMTAHAAITGGSGFGETIRSINGSLECNGGNTGEMQDRVSLYQRFTGILGVDPGDKLTC